jgi:hypothetical protein
MKFVQRPPSGNHRLPLTMISQKKNVLSEHELMLIRETAKLTENLYVKMVCDQLAMENLVRLIR